MSPYFLYATLLHSCVCVCISCQQKCHKITSALFNFLKESAIYQTKCKTIALCADSMEYSSTEQQHEQT